jgi:hypothetical protein
MVITALLDGGEGEHDAGPIYTRVYADGLRKGADPSAEDFEEA